MSETYSRTENGHTKIWNVDRLKQLAKQLPVVEVPLESIKDLDTDMWFGKRIPTCRAVAEHARRIYAADLSHPIILSQHGRVMDGMHRLSRAFLESQGMVKVVRFENDPTPDEER